jgi:thiamine pyrophosphate-dependent acetolactate synthase large subunit-like protein
MMKRDQALQILAEHIPDTIVVPVFQSAFDWMNIRPHPLNYLCIGAMGQASSHALGLALAMPHERIVVLDGDGSLLMNLGSLVTIGSVQPRNLTHFVSHNGIYEVNGRYPIPGGRKIQFDRIAKEAGYADTYSFSDLEEFRREIKNVLSVPGPVFVSLHVEAGQAYPTDYVTIHSAESRDAFRTAVRRRMSGS